MEGGGGKEKGRKEEGEVRGGEGREREGLGPQIFWPRTALRIRVLWMYY